MTSYTVTGSTTNNTFGGGFLQVKVLDNATMAGTPATGTSSTAFNCSVTTTTAGSFVFGTLLNDDATTTFVAESNCTILSQYSNTTEQVQYGAFQTSSGTGTPGATTVGSSTTFPGAYGAAAVEILASGGTLTVDGSSPAAADSLTATSYTTASFTPPGSTLLVAMLTVTGNLSGGSSLCVATVSSTPSLTWTEQVKFNANESGTGTCSYVGVWTAVVPAPSTPGPPLYPQYMGQRPVIVVSGAGWRGAQHSR